MQSGRSIAQGGESLPNTATLHFRHSQGSLGVSRHGRIRPGGRLVVEYGPTRLSQGGSAPTWSADILCHVRFQPLGQTYSETSWSMQIRSRVLAAGFSDHRSAALGGYDSAC
jgi:hypothetical protein